MPKAADITPELHELPRGVVSVDLQKIAARTCRYSAFLEAAMDMTPSDWLRHLRDIDSRKDWDSLYDFQTRTNEQFTRICDGAGLREFYQAVAKIALPHQDAAPFLADDSQSFRQAIASALVKIREEIRSRPEIKGVYFEYYCDGHDNESNTGEFFLCRSYSDEDDEWACDCDRKRDVIHGSRLPHYMFYDDDFEWRDDIRLAADEISNGLLLAAVLDEWKKSEILGIPLALANHDDQIVRASAL